MSCTTSPTRTKAPPLDSFPNPQGNPYAESPGGLNTSGDIFELSPPSVSGGAWTYNIEEHFRCLQLLKISAILSLQDETDISYGGAEYDRTAAGRAGFAFESVPIKEFNDIELQQRLPEAAESLAGLLRKGHSVYVHCNLGTTRSPAVVAAHLRAELTALSQRPRSLPGKVLSLPYACGICGSDKIGYDRLNVVTCGNCDAVLAPSGRWLPWSIKPTL